MLLTTATIITSKPMPRQRYKKAIELHEKVRDVRATSKEYRDAGTTIMMREAIKEH